MNRLPFSTLLSAVSRPKPLLVRDSERLVPEQSLSQGARWSNRAGPTNESARNQGHFNSSRASAVVGNGEKLPSPGDAGRDGVPVIDLPPEQLTSTKDKPNTIREFARVMLRDSSRNSECKREIMVLENIEQC